MTITIKQINSLTEVNKYIKDKHCLLLLDIDNTLMTTYGGEWLEIRENRKEFFDVGDINRIFSGRLYRSGFRFRSNGEFHSYNDKKYLYLVKWFNRQAELGESRLTESNLPKLFNIWNQRCTVVGFTSRGLEIAKVTEKKLEKLGIYFDYRSHRGRYDVFANKTGRSGMSAKCMIYCGGWPKEKIINEMAPVWTIVVFVDDTLSHLRPVGEVMEKDFNEYWDNKGSGFNFIGLHYVPKNKNS